MFQSLAKHFRGRAQLFIKYLRWQNPNVIVYILYGVFYETMYSMYRPFAIKFLERLGGTGHHISLFYSLPGLMAACALLPGCILLSRFKNKKNVTSVLFLISRSLVLCIAFIPFLSPSARPLAFVCAIAFMNLPEALAQTSLQTCLGDVFSVTVRARAIALRNKFGNMVTLIVTLLTGFIISYAPKTDDQRIIFYQLFFVLSFLFGMLEIGAFRRFKLKEQPEAGPEAGGRGADLSYVKAALKNKRFMAFLLSTTCFQFSWQAGWPITSVYQIEVLHSSEMWFALYAVASGLAAFFSAGFWNKRINIWGNPKSLLLASLFMALNMLFMGLSPNVQCMALVHVFAGFSTIGINTTILNGIFLASPEEGRIVYLGVYNTFVNLSLFVSPLAASLLIGHFGVQTSMFISFGLRFAGMLAILVGNRVAKRFA